VFIPVTSLRFFSAILVFFAVKLPIVFSMTQTKPQLRRDMKAPRAAMSTDEVTRASDVIRQHVLDLKQLREANSVFTYVSIHNEPDTRNLIRDLLALGKRVSVPRIDPTGIMQAHLITSLDDLQPGGPDQFNIPVPPPDSPIDPYPGVTLVPGLAFTQAGQRLGMGRGHYDRYLAQHPAPPGSPGTFTIGLCYNWQIIDHLPTETHDQPVNKLVTDARVLSCFG
jgi:5-formyltetrahydrofolate cyclo-ligase